MTQRPGDLSLADLRRLLAEEDPVADEVLGALRQDRRKGARRLASQAARRRRQADARRLRTDVLLEVERRLWRGGVRRVAGVDEAGVGPLAGPVVAAAVVFPPGTAIEGVDDSKGLDAEARAVLAEGIWTAAQGVGIGVADVDEIASLNVYHAALAAMGRAVDDLPEAPEQVIVDARRIPGLGVPQRAIVKGDSKVFSVAAASIIAKIHRDALMVELDAQYPQYGFARHKGYATPEHRAAIRDHGPSPVHRHSYAYLRELGGAYSDAFYTLRGQLSVVLRPPDLVAFEEALARAKGELPAEEYAKLRLLLGRRRRRLGSRPSRG